MSAPAGPEMYSKLIDDDGLYDNFTGEQGSRVSPSVAGRPQGRSAASPGLSPGPGPGPSTGRGPGLYKASAMALAALCVILLICVIALSTHNQKTQTSEGETIPQTEKQKQEVNVTELLSIISKLKEENQQLRAELNSSKAVQTLPPPLQCPANWLPFSGSCYFISSQTRTWSDSQSYCNSQGGHLAIILSAEEQTFLWDLLPRGYWNSFWFGITDSHIEDQWKWVDGTPLVGGFWEEGEPNNHVDEDCGYIVKTEVLTRVAIRSWYDAPCSMRLPFICEKE
ncbi:hypothetical protein NL108_014212 [Boleophthalmus pectinirostris]|uniref:CD209 antigen-like protein E n=1 Tax=Boleophthalmus pectinirostris TaxID=150288 RepID=UPI00242A7FCF|nr:CD209 antigen-like protein E [Boleophthalmus pectinirostris]KAJ0055304.1 hypothetical protein NL108_014212 [Boleophthalmus pectinirostris]